MEIYNGNYFGAETKIEYKDKRVEITKTLGDKTLKFDYKAYEARNYHTLILKQLSYCISETLKEMQSKLDHRHSPKLLPEQESERQCVAPRHAA